MIDHQMDYRAGRVGLSEVGLPDIDPHWRCTCGNGWTYPAVAMPSRRTGNNRIEAERAHRQHTEARR